VADGIRPEDAERYWWYRDMDGQKVTFYVNKDYKERKPFIYYARVINPGEFKAEAPIIQGTKAKDSIKLGKQTTVVITE